MRCGTAGSQTMLVIRSLRPASSKGLKSGKCLQACEPLCMLQATTIYPQALSTLTGSACKPVQQTLQPYYISTHVISKRRHSNTHEPEPEPCSYREPSYGFRCIAGAPYRGALHPTSFMHSSYIPPIYLLGSPFKL